MTTLEDGARQVRIQHVVATGGSIVIQVAGDLVVSEEGLAASWATVATRPGECPYPGIGAFGPGQAKWFFGRDKLTGDLLEMLDGSLRAGRGGPFIAVGASGAGKSSLLAAGLVKALGDGRLAVPGSERWPVLAITPGSGPLQTLTEAVSRCTAELVSRAGYPQRPSEPGWESAFANLRETLHRSSVGNASQRVMVVVDKLEELFAAGCGEAERSEFLDALAAIAASAPGGPAGLVVLGMRADFYASATQYPALRDALQSRQLVVGAMTLAEVTQAITGPARAVGLQLESGLTERLLRDLGVSADGDGYEPGRLPLLGQALRATWQRRNGDWLTIGGYEDAGGIGGAIAKAAEDAYSGLGDPAQQAARLLFLSMVQVGSGEPGGEGTADTRRRVSKSRLCSATPDPGIAQSVLDVFTQARLITSAGQTAEITHEALLSRWPRLREWIEQDRAGHLIRQPLEEAAEAWDRAGRDPSADLYTGSRLAQAQAWASDLAASRDLSGRARAFLAASGDRQRQAKRRAIRRRNRVIVALTALSLVAVSAAVVARQEDQTAGQQRDAAVARQLAVESEALDATNPVEAASLAAAAWKIDPITEARDSLLDVLAQPARGAVTAVNGNMSAIKFSSDGKRFATATDNGVTQIWDTATHREIGKPLVLGGGENLESITFDAKGVAATVATDGGPGRFWDITTRRPIGGPFQIPDEGTGLLGSVFSPDGKVVAVGIKDGNFAFVDVATHREIGSAVLEATPLVFSPDGKIIAVALPRGPNNPYGTVELLDAATHRPTGAAMSSMAQSLPGAAFSPDGKVIAISGPKSVYLWNISERHIVGSPIAVTASGIAFSPDGKMLATVGDDGTADLWNVSTHQQLGGPLAAGSNTEFPVLAFSPDSKILATASGSTVTFWDVKAWRQVGATIPHAFSPVEFSPDGKLLLMRVYYGATLWSVTGRRRIGAEMVVNPHHAKTDIVSFVDVAFSPDGKTIATAGGTGMPVQLWSVATQRKTGVKEFRGRLDASNLAFSPDGKLLAATSGGDKNAAWIWDVHSGHVIGHSMTGGYALAFSPDGKLLAIVNGQVRLYNVLTHREVGIPLATGFASTDGQVNQIAFNPSGSIIATASESGVTLWDVATRRKIGASLNFGMGPVQALAFSPDGTILAAGGQDGAIRMWDISSREQIGTVLDASAHSPVDGIAFSPDGALLATSTNSGVQIWGAVSTQNIVNRVCEITDGPMTRQDWGFYVSSESYRQTCPANNNDGGGA